MPSDVLWRGPESPHPQGGITFGLLNRFLACRERFRVHALEGLRPRPRFNHKMEFGTLWHLAEETYSLGGDWRGAVLGYAEKLAAQYPFDRDEIDRWYNVVLVQFPVYLSYWRVNKDSVSVRPLFREGVFDVPYALPSGRVCRLRGRFDGADLVGGGADGVVYLDEKKTKGEVDQQKISRQLTWDLQTMLYIIALEPHLKSLGVERRIQGVRYSVVRRPLSGGEGDIKQKKGSKNVPAESKAEYYDRLKGVIDGTGLNSKGDRYTGPSAWFYRWDVDVAPGDIARFREKTLDPLLEFVCNWYDSQVGNPWTGMHDDSVLRSLHWQQPFGCFDPLADGGQSELDAYVTMGDSTGLVRVTDLFPELC